MVGEEGIAVRVGTHGTAGINGGATGNEGMSLGRPPPWKARVEIEDVRQLDACGRHDIGARRG